MNATCLSLCKSTILLFFNRDIFYSIRNGDSDSIIRTKNTQVNIFQPRFGYYPTLLNKNHLDANHSCIALSYFLGSFPRIESIRFRMCLSMFLASRDWSVEGSSWRRAFLSLQIEWIAAWKADRSKSRVLQSNVVSVRLRRISSQSPEYRFPINFIVSFLNKINFVYSNLLSSPLKRSIL